jgi:hypothetical protein
MKKNIEETSPEISKKPTSNVRSYFTKEINDQIAEMPLKEMESLMKEMISTRNWIALLKYTGMRTPILDAQLRSINPIENPHTISWSQGCLAGLCDIETYVIDLNSPEPTGDDQGNNPNNSPEGVIDN